MSRHRVSRRRSFARFFAKFLMVIIVGAASFGFAAVAWSYFTSLGHGPGLVKVASLAAPTDVVASFPTPSERTVVVSWSAPKQDEGVVVDGYYVTRSLDGVVSPACDSSPTSLITTTSCSDTNLASHTYSYTVTEVFRTWTAQTVSPSVTVSAATLSKFILTPSTSSPAAGTAFGVTVTAYDQYGEVDTDYTGDQCVAIAGPSASPRGQLPAYATGWNCTGGVTIPFANGVSSPTMTLYDAAAQTLSVTDIGTGVSGSVPLMVGPGALHEFVVAPSTTTPVAGTGFSIGVTALDDFGNVDTNYTGVQCLTFSGPLSSPGNAPPTYPTPSCDSGSSVDFSSGVGNPDVTLFDAQATTLTVTDEPTGHFGWAGVSVGPAPLSSFQLTPTSDQVAGSPIGVAMTAYDQYGNVDTNYSGGQCLTFSGLASSPNHTAPQYPGAGSCANGSQVEFASGASGGANEASVIDFDAQSAVLGVVATPGGQSGSTPLSVASASLRSFTVVASTNAPTAGVAFSLGLTVLDPYGNLDVSYTGAQCLAFAGPTAAPDGTAPDYQGAPCAGGTTVAFSSGSATEGVTLFNTQSASITATDVPTGHFGWVGVSVGPSSLDSFRLSTTTGASAGSSVGVALRAYDQYANLDTDYSGQHCLTFSGLDPSPNGTDPAYPLTGSCATGSSAVTFANGVANGANLVSLTPVDAQVTTLRVRAMPGGQSGSTSLAVSPDSINMYGVVPSTATPVAGQPFTLRVSVLDQYGNVETGYSNTDCVTFVGPDDSPNATSPTYSGSSCADGESLDFTNGVGTETVTLVDAETTAITALNQADLVWGVTNVAVSAMSTVAGIGLVDVTTNTAPNVVCTDQIGTESCATTLTSSTQGNTLVSSIQLEDQYGNAVVNSTSAPIAIDLSTVPDGDVVPSGASVLSVPIGQSMTSAAFTLSNNAGSDVPILSAVIDATTMTLTITMNN